MANIEQGRIDGQESGLLGRAKELCSKARGALIDLGKRLVPTTTIAVIGTGAILVPESTQAKDPVSEANAEGSVQTGATVEGPVRYRSSVEITPEEQEKIKAIIGLMESEGIPAREAVNLVAWLDQTPLDGFETDTFKSELKDRLEEFNAPLHDLEETDIWDEDLKEALQEFDVQTLIKVADLLIQYFKEKGASKGRIQAANAMIAMAEKEHADRPTEELRRKILALKMLVKNQTALENFNKDSVQGTAENLIRIDWPSLAAKQGYKFEVYDPCQDKKFTGKVKEDGYYIDENGERKDFQSIVDSASNCAPLQSTFVSETLEPVGFEPRDGDAPVEEPEEEKKGNKTKINPYVFARYRFAAMSLVNDSDTQQPMQNHTIQGGLGVQIGPEAPHIGYAAVTVSGGMSAIPGRPNQNTAAEGRERATAGNLTLGLEGNFHIPEKQKWMGLDFTARAELHALFGPKDLITNKVRLGGGAGLGAGLKWWLGKNSRFGLTFSGGWDHLINPTDHGHRLGEFALERPFVKSNNLYLNGGVIFRFGKKDEENKK